MSNLSEAFASFNEALTRQQHRARVDSITARLGSALSRAFRSQGSQFVRELKKQAGHHFSEGGDPFVQYAGLLNGKFSEAISFTDWIMIWAATASNTIKLFSAPLDAAVLRALKAGGAAQIADLGMDIKFDLQNPRAVKYLKDYGAKLVAGINEETQRQLQALLAQAADEGWSYDRTAKAITDKFDGFADGRPQDHIDSRAHGIAVTELGNAYAEGNLEAAQSLADAGIEMEKSWSTVGDAKVSEICAGNEAAGWIPLDDSFPSGDDRPLAHPYCRCDLLIRVKGTE